MGAIKAFDLYGEAVKQFGYEAFLGHEVSHFAFEGWLEHEVPMLEDYSSLSYVLSDLLRTDAMLRASSLERGCEGAPQ